MRRVSAFAAILLLTNAAVAQMTWTCATSSADWAARSGQTAVYWAPVEPSIWVLGGGNAGTSYNDVWYSSDGENWTQAVASAAWPTRKFHTTVKFGGKIWVIGGYTHSGGTSNDVWSSPDGVNWTQATASAGWMGRCNHTSVVAGSKIWVMGGHSTGSGRLNDVWNSSDGVNWTEATAWAPWTARSGHASVFFDNKIWVLGGCDNSYLSDVWYTSDGENWTCATASAGWHGRANHCAVVVGNRMWVLGGDYIDGSTLHCLNDVWCSSDGVNWTRANASAGWSGRMNAASVVDMYNRIWMLGGAYELASYMNDVWYSGIVGIEENTAPETPMNARAVDVKPNPFRTSLCISYSLGGLVPVKLGIYDRTGREVKVLYNGRQDTGLHEARWDGRDEQGRRLPVGTYFCQLEVDGESSVRAMVKTQ